MRTSGRLSDQLGADLLLDLGMGSPQARGCFSARRAARWLLEAHDWEKLELEVLETLQEFEPPAGVDLDMARSALESASISGTADLALIRIPENRRSADDAGAIHEAVERDGTLEMSYENEEVHILIDDRDLEHVLEASGNPEVEGRGSLYKIHVKFRKWGEPTRVARIVILALLEAGGCGVLRSRPSRGALGLFLPASQAIRAVALIDGLTKWLVDSES